MSVAASVHVDASRGQSDCESNACGDFSGRVLSSVVAVVCCDAISFAHTGVISVSSGVVLRSCDVVSCEINDRARTERDFG